MARPWENGGIGLRNKGGIVQNCPLFLRFFSCFPSISHVFYTFPKRSFGQFLTIPQFSPFSPISPHYPRFPPNFPRFSLSSPIFPHFSIFPTGRLIGLRLTRKPECRWRCWKVAIGADPVFAPAAGRFVERRPRFALIQGCWARLCRVFSRRVFICPPGHRQAARMPAHPLCLSVLRGWAPTAGDLCHTLFGLVQDLCPQCSVDTIRSRAPLHNIPTPCTPTRDAHRTLEHRSECRVGEHLVTLGVLCYSCSAQLGGNCRGTGEIVPFCTCGSLMAKGTYTFGVQ